MITIKKEEYDRLLDRELKLEALEQGGIDNWVGYEDAMEAYHEITEEENN